MPLLLLLRHAKASPAERGMSDRDRPLAPEGHRAAERIAARIMEPALLPDRILCSPARRTQETLAPLAVRLGDRVVTLPELYEQSEGHYLVPIAENGDAVERLLVIGHNPAIHATALALLISSDRSGRGSIADGFPTGALAVIECPEGWSRLRPGTGRLVAFIRQRDLSGPDGEKTG